MQKNNLLIRNTILALHGIVVLYVGFNRLQASDDPASSGQGISAAELAKLRDFSAIEVNGDLGVDVVQGAEYAVHYEPPNRSSIVATVRGDTLVLSSFHNKSRVRVTLPELKQVNTSSDTELSISGFGGENVELRLDGTADLILRNNSVRHWRIVAADVSDVRVDRTSIGAGQIDLSGHVTLRVID